MNIPEICITFIAGILGVAYPILIEVVSRLDEKYSSLVVTDLFNREREYKLFRTFLKSSLVGVFLYMIINLPFMPFMPFFMGGKYLALVLVSLLILSTGFLIISFLLFVNKVLLYYSTFRLLNYLNRKEENEEQKFFQATADILNRSIKKEDTLAAKTASEFIYKKFKHIRLNSSGRPVLYPNIFYQTVNDTIRELVFTANERFAYLEHRTIGGLWYLGDHEQLEISETTFVWMWSGLVFATKHNRDDMIMKYWGVAHQHFIYQLRRVEQVWDFGGRVHMVKNDDEVKKRMIERERFLEFTQALGGLMLYRSRFEVVKRMFRYTTSIPYTYELLPLTMDEVFSIYFRFIDPYKDFIDERYYFPELEGIQGEGIVRSWICKYAALLFLRQYTIIPHLIYITPLKVPNIPAKQSDKRMWMDNLDNLKTLVLNLFEDRLLMEEVGFGYLTIERIIEDGETPPAIFFDNLKTELTNAFEDVEINQDISEDKKREFLETSKEIINNGIDPYCRAFERQFDQQSEEWFVGSGRMVLEKNAFSDNTDIHYDGFSGALALQMVNNFQNAISEMFHRKSTKSFLLTIADFYRAINKLAVDPTNHVIVNFGVDLQSDINFSNITDLTTDEYRGIKIVSFQRYNTALMNPTFFVLAKKDMPALIIEPIKREEADKYELEPIDDHGLVRASIIDLNTNEQIRDEIATEGGFDNLKKSVLVYIGMNVKIHWKKPVRVIALERYSEFNDRGAPNEITDIRMD